MSRHLPCLLLRLIPSSQFLPLTNLLVQNVRWQKPLGTFFVHSVTAFSTCKQSTAADSAVYTAPLKLQVLSCQTQETEHHGQTFSSVAVHYSHGPWCSCPLPSLFQVDWNLVVLRCLLHFLVRTLNAVCFHSHCPMNLYSCLIETSEAEV